MDVSLSPEKINLKLPFPNLIFKYLDYFHEILATTRDHRSAYPLPLKLDSKAASAHTASLVSPQKTRRCASSSTALEWRGSGVSRQHEIVGLHKLKREQS